MSRSNEIAARQQMLIYMLWAAGVAFVLCNLISCKELDLDEVNRPYGFHAEKFPSWNSRQAEVRP